MHPWLFTRFTSRKSLVHLCQGLVSAVWLTGGSGTSRICPPVSRSAPHSGGSRPELGGLRTCHRRSMGLEVWESVGGTPASSWGTPQWSWRKNGNPRGRRKQDEERMRHAVVLFCISLISGQVESFKCLLVIIFFPLWTVYSYFLCVDLSKFPVYFIVFYI